MDDFEGNLMDLKFTVPALLTSTAIICGGVVLFRERKGDDKRSTLERLRLSCISGEIVDSFAMILGLVSFVVGMSMFASVLFLSLPVGAQVGVCVSLCGLGLIGLAIVRYANANGILAFLPEKMRDDLTRKSFLELWEAPPPAWVHKVAKYVKQLVLVGVAKGEDRVVLIDRLPESFTRRGMAYFLPRPLQNMILPPSMRVNSSVRTHSHDRVVGVSASMPSNHPATTPDQTPPQSCPFSSMFGRNSNSTNSSRRARDLTGSDVIRNLFMFELRRTILGIPEHKLNLAFMASAGALAFQLTARRARSDIWRIISAVTTILTSVSTGGLFAAVLLRWVLKRRGNGQTTSLLNVARSAVMLALTKCRAVALRSMNQFKAMILVFVLYVQRFLGVSSGRGSGGSSGSTTKEEDEDDEDGTTHD